MRKTVEIEDLTLFMNESVLQMYAKKGEFDLEWSNPE